MADATIASPCISVCAIDPVSGLCCGCFRTLDEIAGWIDFSPADKREVIAALCGRRAAFGAAIEARMERPVERPGEGPAEKSMEERMDDSAKR
jgi:uncharacterized protein